MNHATANLLRRFAKLSGQSEKLVKRIYNTYPSNMREKLKSEIELRIQQAEMTRPKPVKSNTIAEAWGS